MLLAIASACAGPASTRAGRRTILPMLRYQIVPVTPFQQNCSIVWCSDTMEGAVIDPGGDLPRLQAAVARLGVQLHADPAHPCPHRPCRRHRHAGAHAGPAHRRPAPGRPVLDRRPGRAGHDVRLCPGRALHAHAAGWPTATPSRWVAARWQCAIARATRRGMWCSTAPRPSAPLSATCCLPAASAAPTFRAATTPRLIASITQRLWPMGDDTVFIPGHGPESSFGAERRHNPHVGGT